MRQVPSVVVGQGLHLADYARIIKPLTPNINQPLIENPHSAVSI